MDLNEGCSFLGKRVQWRGRKCIGSQLFFYFSIMSFSAYVWGIRLLTLLASGAWIGIVLSIDPKQGGSVGRALFFVSFFAMLLGVVTLSVTWAYRKALGDAGAAHHAGSAFRQALLLAVFIAGSAFLQYLRLLTWWDAALFFAIILAVEFTVRRMSRA